MTNRAYEWVAEAEADERARVRAARRARLWAAVINAWTAIKAAMGA